MFVAGIDSSTQSCKVLVCDLDGGTVARSGVAKHPDGTEVDPKHWLDALKEAIEKAGGIADCKAVSVAGQQHGCVVLDENGEVIRPALLWNDTKSADAANDLIAEKGAEFWAEKTGCVPVASFTATKLRFLANNEPENVKRIKAICLPHDYLSWQLQGGFKNGGFSNLFTDRSDASGTLYFDPEVDEYLPDVLDIALNGSKNGHLVDIEDIVLPVVKINNAVCGKVAREFSDGNEILIGPGAGDNASAAFALDLQNGDVCVSLGTSGTVSMVTEKQTHDSSGTIAGFASVDSKFLPLVCTLNASRVIDTVKNGFSISYDDFDKFAEDGQNGGLTLIPYFEGERTPNRPLAEGSFLGITNNNFNIKNIARATLEGILCGQRDGIKAIQGKDIKIKHIKLIGGAVKSEILRKIAPIIFDGISVDVPKVNEYVALGAAKQAAWVLTKKLPDWDICESKTYTGTFDKSIIDRYNKLKENRSFPEL